MADELAGQVAIITGGGRGIGRAIASAFAMAGASVAVTARSADQLAETVSIIEGWGGRAIGLTGDVTDLSEMEAIVAETERSLGAVTTLVNNAGAPGAIGPLWEVDLDNWKHCLEVNLYGPLLASRAVLPGMIARGTGRIISVASGAAIRPLPFDTAYGASKTALVRLMEALSIETAELGIKCFAFGPGVVRTAMHDNFRSDLGKTWMPHITDYIEANASPPERPAQLAVFLASGAADGLSGTYVSVSDDIEALANKADAIRQAGAQRLQLKTID